MQCLRWSKLKAHEGQGRASVRHHKDAGCASEFAERLCACSIERFLCCRKWCHERSSDLGIRHVGDKIDVAALLYLRHRWPPSTNVFFRRSTTS